MPAELPLPPPAADDDSLLAERFLFSETRLALSSRVRMRHATPHPNKGPVVLSKEVVLQHAQHANSKA
jgi:hypothetical protein